MSAIKLTLCLTIEGIEETVPLVISYDYRKAWSGGGISPDEPAACDITRVAIANRVYFWRKDIDDEMIAAFDRLIEGDEFQALLMQDAFEDKCAAEEYRADAARDDRLLGDRT